MRFSFAESMTDPSYYLPLARAAEEAGYDSMVVPDSICYPEVSDTTYPFNPDGTREFLEDKPFLEPFSLIPAMGAVTERIRFVTFVIKLPIRQPVLIAKQVSSTAVLTDNRLLLGVGTSPWPEDYEICGVPWEKRGTAHGRGDRHHARPHGRRLLRVPRRDVRRPVHKDVPDAEPSRADPDRRAPRGRPPAGRPRRGRLVARRRRPRRPPGAPHAPGRAAQEHGTDTKPFETHVISLDAYTPDGVERLEELGVTDVIVGFRWPYGVEQDTETLQTKVDNLQRFADDVIAKVR